MKQSHGSRNQKLYKIYIWGGLPLIVIYIIVAVLVFDAPGIPGSKGFLITIGPMIIWFAGILLYWWWAFLVKGNKELKELAKTPSVGVPAIKALANWNALYQAMAISGGNIEELIKKTKKANRPVIIWFGFMNLMPIWVFGFIILGSLGIIPANTFPVMVGGVIFLIIGQLVLTYLLLGWGSKSAEKAFLSPLGLAVTQVPGLKPNVIGLIGDGQKLIPDGPAIVEGERYGRLVHIETFDKHCLTVLQVQLPEFKVLSEDGKLTPDENTPKEVIHAIKSLRKAKRWKGIAVYSGPDGIAIQRHSKGTNMWLYDLWLAEYLLENIS